MEVYFCDQNGYIKTTKIIVENYNEYKLYSIDGRTSVYNNETLNIGDVLIKQSNDEIKFIFCAYIDNLFTHNVVWCEYIKNIILLFTNKTDELIHIYYTTTLPSNRYLNIALEFLFINSLATTLKNIKLI